MDERTDPAVPADPWSRPPTEPDRRADPSSDLDRVTGRPTWPPRDPVTGRPLGEESLAPPTGTPATPIDASGRVPWMPSDTPNVPPASARAGRGTRRAALITGVAILAALTLKIGTGLLVTGVASGALSGMFGGPYDRLPSDYKHAMEGRLRAAVPGIDAMSKAEVEAKLTPLVTDGLLRLDDAQTVVYWSAITTALNRADTSRCAAVARESISGGASAGSVSSKLPDSLDEPTLESLLTVTVAAIEAGSRQSPPQQTVEQATARPLLTRLAAGLTSSEIADLSQLDSASLPDDRACSSARAIFRSVGTLGPRDEATLVRYMLSN